MRRIVSLFLFLPASSVPRSIIRPGFLRASVCRARASLASPHPVCTLYDFIDAGGQVDLLHAESTSTATCSLEYIVSAFSPYLKFVPSGATVRRPLRWSAYFELHQRRGHMERLSCIRRTRVVWFLGLGRVPPGCASCILYQC